MNEAKPTPHELASLAALLASLEKDSKVTSLKGFFPLALRVWQDAAEFLKQPDDTAGPMDVIKVAGFECFPIEMVLKPVEPAVRGKKRGRTMVGAVTTKDGLVKAIRRIWPDTADEIIRRGGLYQFEIDGILNEKMRSNERRTKAATEARKRTVK